MAKFRKRPVVIKASRWRKNGDRPEDYSSDSTGLENGEPRIFTGAYRKQQGWEGSIVRYFRRPDVSEEEVCQHCALVMHVHGWIDTKEGGHIVCPGDWIITGIQGERYPCKPDIFDATYELETAGATSRDERVRGLEAELSACQESLRWALEHLREPITEGREAHNEAYISGYALAEKRTGIE